MKKLGIALGGAGITTVFIGASLLDSTGVIGGVAIAITVIGLVIAILGGVIYDL